MWETQNHGFSLWTGRSPGGGNGYPLQYFCLESPMYRGAWWATIHGVTEELNKTNWAHTHTHPYIYVVYRYMHVGESIWRLYNKSNNSNTFTYFSRDQATYFIWELREFSNGTKQQYVQWWVHLINCEEKVEKFNSPCVQMYFQIYYEILGQTKIRRWRSGGKSIHFSTTITVLKKNL